MNETEALCDSFAKKHGWKIYSNGWADKWYQKGKNILFVEVKPNRGIRLAPNQKAFKKMINGVISGYLTAGYVHWTPNVKDSVFIQYPVDLKEKELVEEIKNPVLKEKFDKLRRENYNLRREVSILKAQKDRKYKTHYRNKIKGKIEKILWNSYKTPILTWSPTDKCYFYGSEDNLLLFNENYMLEENQKLHKEISTLCQYRRILEGLDETLKIAMYFLYEALDDYDGSKHLVQSAFRTLWSGFIHQDSPSVRSFHTPNLSQSGSGYYRYLDFCNNYVGGKQTSILDNLGHLLYLDDVQKEAERYRNKTDETK